MFVYSFGFYYGFVGYYTVYTNDKQLNYKNKHLTESFGFIKCKKWQTTSGQRCHTTCDNRKRKSVEIGKVEFGK